MAIKLFNTLTQTLEEFRPITEGKVKMYNCGPTVYGVQHIGNLSMFVFTDILRRTLEYNGLEVKQVINFTDFGHLTSDADEGEDKMAKGLKREGLSPSIDNMQAMGKKYAGIFLADITKLNINTNGTTFPYASEYVEDQKKLIETLENKGFAYSTSDGIYFDTSKFSDYGKLGYLSESDNRGRITSNEEKYNPRDFALWKLNNEVGFESKWGQGFPGWHIECSAMILKILGEQIDIHTGGIEHILVHHNNEIAQSEAATGKKPFSKYWLHRAHLQIEGEKIAKSDGNVVYLSEIIEKEFSPLAFRYFLFLSHYRTPTNFSWEALEAAQNAYKRLKETFHSFVDGNGRTSEKYKSEFQNALGSDLNTPEALAVVWKLFKDDNVSVADKRATLVDLDRVLGLNLEHNEFEVKEVPERVMKLKEERDIARVKNEFERADKLREEIEKEGYSVKDGPNLSVLFKL